MYTAKETYITGKQVIELLPVGTFKGLINRGKITNINGRASRFNPAQYRVDDFPPVYKNRLYEAYPYLAEAKKRLESESAMTRSVLEDNIYPDPAALAFYQNYFSGKKDEARQVATYYANAIVLNACEQAWNKSYSAHMREGRANKMTKCDFWVKMKAVIENLGATEDEDKKQKYPHSLYLSWQKLMYKYERFIGKDGRRDYAALINGRVGNKNRIKVTPIVEKMLLSLYAQVEKPFAKDVWQAYIDFIHYKIDVVNTKTGEVFNPLDFYDDGYPVEISESTVWNWINKPENRRAVDALRNDFKYNQTKYNPIKNRKSPCYSLSKVSLDDVDLVRKFKKYDEHGRYVGDRTVHAYYAWDVASGAVIGRAYSESKNAHLIKECMRDMLRNLLAWGLNLPYEVEVEQHLMKGFSEELYNTFQEVTWCAAMNDRQKRAENFNKQRKYYGPYSLRAMGLAKGRFYALHESYLGHRDKIFDEDNNNYKEQLESGEWGQVVAEDKAQIDLMNMEAFHIGGKKQENLEFEGKRRLEIVQLYQNPRCAPLNLRIAAKNWGESHKTSIVNSQYCNLSYRKWKISHVDIIDRLEPNNYEVMAYWIDTYTGKMMMNGLPETEITQAYLYQGDKYIDEVHELPPFQEAKVEQTECDIQEERRQMGFSAAYKAKRRAAIENKIDEGIKAIPAAQTSAAIAQPVEVPVCADDVEGFNDEWTEGVEINEEEVYAMAISRL